MNKPPRSSDSYRRAEHHARIAESLTKWVYHICFYRCIGSRIRTPFGELDLCMVRGRRLVIIEVKYRVAGSVLDETSWPRAEQMRRIRNAVAWKYGDKIESGDYEPTLHIARWHGWLKCRIHRVSV